MPIIAGQITGSALSGSLDYTFLSNIPSGIVSGAAQVAANLPAGTVSSSGQVDITSTTNYSTFSSSLATVDAGQTTRIDNLASLTSSYAINATIQGQLAGVASSSAQVKTYLPADTVSSSGQVSITATTGYSTFSSSIATKNDLQDVSINALNAATSSYAINATIQGQLAGVVSSSTQVKPLLPGGTVSSSAQYPGWVTASSQIDVRNTTGIATIATTGSNTFNGTQIVTGSLFTSGSNNLVGSTTLSGSLIVSGAAVTSTPNIKIYGDTEFTGYAKFNPVTSNIDTSISASYIYVSGSTQDLYFSQNSAGYSNVTRLRWLESNLYTGLLKGGILTTTTGSTTFNISAGEGVVVTLNASTTQDPYPTIKLVRWDAKTNVPITYSGSAKITYVGLDVAGNVIQQTVPWGSTDINQFDTQINLGVVLHSSGSVSTGAYNAPQISYGFPQKSDDFFRSFGPLKISGHTLQASGSSPTLSIKKTAGTSYREGSNYETNPNHPNTVTEASDITISKIYRYYISGSTPVIDTGASGSGYPTLDNQNRVDTATGLLTPIGLSNWSIQRVFWVPKSPTNAFIVYYGNAAYSTLLNAVNAINTEPFTEAPDTAANAVFIGYIIIEGGINRDLLNSAHASIIQGGLFRNIAGVGSGGTQPVATTLAGLSDVGISSPAIGDLLIYNGATWNNTKSLNGSYSLTGSLATNDGITAITINATAVSASLSGSGAGVFGVNYNTLSNIPAGIVSSSAQVQPLLPGGTVSSSAQYPGWVTSSAQIDITATTGYSTFSSSLATVDAGQTTRIDNLASQTSSYAINATIQSQLAGVVSSSTQVAPLLPGGTVSASGQVDITATTNYSTFSSSLATVDAGQTTRIDNLASLTSSYAVNSTIQGQLAGVVSSSAQVKPLLPGGTVSASGQIDITATTGYSTFSSSLATVDAGQTTRIDNLASQTSSYAINATIQGQLAGVVSSSAQVKPLLPGGTVTSSAQYPGWVTSSTQIDYNSIQNKLSGVISSSTQFNALTGTSASFAATASYVNTLLQTVSASGDIAAGVNLVSNFSSGDEGGEIQLARPQTNSSISGSVTIDIYQNKLRIFEANSPNRGAFIDFTGLASGVNRNLLGNDGVVSSSGQVSITATTGYSTFSSSIATKNDLQDVSINALNAATSSYAINTTIQGQLAGVVSSSTQVKPLLPGGTVSASGQVDITATTGYSTFSSSLATVDAGQTTRIDNLASLTSSYAINATIQGQLAGVVSSSTQVKPLLPNGTVSSSGQVDITATTNYSTFSSSLATIDAGQTARIDNLASLTSSYAINSTIQSQLAGVISSSAQTVASIANQTIAPTNVNATNILSGSVLQTGTNALIGGKLAVTGALEVTGTVTASNLTANQAVFTNASDGLVSNAITGTGNVVMSASPTLTGTLTAANITANGTLLLQSIFSSSTQVDYNSIQNKLSGVVSSSTQVQPLLPGGTVSSSAQYPGWVTASSQIALSGITGTTFAATDFTFPNNLTVGGTITAEKINTEYVSASVIFESGSSKFGDTADDVMSVTGSIRVLGGTISGSMVGMFSSSAQTDITATTGYSTFSSSIATKNNLQDVSITALNAATSSYAINSTIQSQLAGVASSSAQVKAYLPADTVSSSTQVVAGVAAQTIAPTNVNATNILSGSVLQTGTNALIGGKLAVTGSTEFTGTITASNLTANQAVFTNAVDGLVSNAITGTGNVVMSTSPTLVTPILGTPTSVTLTNATGLPVSTGISGLGTNVASALAVNVGSAGAFVTFNGALGTPSSATLTNATGLPVSTGISGLGTGVATFLATPSSANLASAVTDETGTGALVFANSPTLVTPALGTPSSVTLTNATGLPVSTGISGLGANVATFLATPSSANLATAVTDETGTGALVFAGSPTLTGTVTANNIVMSGSQFSGIVSGSGLQYRLVVPVGTNQYAT